jgi:cobalt transporter subunit CbtA
MISRVLSVSLMAGFAAGLLIAALQQFTTTPLILAAEVFESAATEPSTARHADNGVARVWSGVSREGEARVFLVHSGHDAAGGKGEASWKPADGIERTIYTSTATVGTAIGFALLLLAGMLAAGDRIDEKTALGWAAAGFVVTGLAPAAGLAPELPGMPAADLLARQTWWAGTAAATAVALWLFLRSGSPWLRVLAVALILAPHVLGAPHLHEATQSRVPPDLAARFAATSLVVHAALWCLTGLLVGWLWQRAGAEKAA